MHVCFRFWGTEWQCGVFTQVVSECRLCKSGDPSRGVLPPLHRYLPLSGKRISLWLHLRFTSLPLLIVLLFGQSEREYNFSKNPISDGPLGTIASGSSFLHPPSDQNEVVNCQKRPCPVQCSNPVPSDACCPVCDSCLYEGVVHTHGHTFTASSNPCQHCTCARGTVTCVPLVCPQTPCLRPVTKPGQCCPECTGACELCNLLY